MLARHCNGGRGRGGGLSEWWRMMAVAPELAWIISLIYTNHS